MWTTQIKGHWSEEIEALADAWLSPGRVRSMPDRSSAAGRATRVGGDRDRSRGALKPIVEQQATFEGSACPGQQLESLEGRH